MKRNWTYLLAALGLGIVMLAASGCEKLKARDHLNKGVQAYRNAQYPLAIEHFKQAVSLDPNFPTARLYLATAYMVQYIPGAESPENTQLAKDAHREFLKVLEQDPQNSVAIASIASLYFNQKKFDEATEWYNKMIGVDPNNKEAHYTLGVIAWTKAFQDTAAARAKLGMKPEDPGPLKDKKVREELKAKNWEMIQQGIQNLEKALAIDAQYDDAMAYLNLLYRQRADLQDSSDAYRKDTEIADNWVEKTLETKKLKTGGATAAAQ